MLTKYLQITFSDNKTYLIPAYIIVKPKAQYWTEKDLERERKSKHYPNDIDIQKMYDDNFNAIMDDDYEIKEWASNSMKWEDMKDFAIEIENSYIIDYDRDFINTEMKVIEK